MAADRQLLQLAQLPACSVRYSARAKRLRLSVLPDGRIEVVAPQGLDRCSITQFVEGQRRWLLRTLQRLQAHRADRPELLDAVPSSIVLPAAGERWDVSYRADVRRPTAVGGDRPALLCPSGDAARSRALLGQWLSRRAAAHLLPLLDVLSAEVGLPYSRAGVRAQKTRWGSCSSRQAISLNRNLMFLDPALVRYLLLHELCHTRHMNHSARYWALLTQFEPDCRRLDAELRQAWRSVPVWACAR